MSQGYEFRFRTQRLALVLALAGALGSAVIAAALFTAGIAFSDVRLVAISSIAGAVMLVGASAAVLRRALLQCSDCRIGEAGVYLITLREERFMPWSAIVDVMVQGRTVRIFYTGDAGSRVEAWVSAPRARQRELDRLAIFVRSTLARRAANAAAQSGASIVGVA